MCICTHSTKGLTSKIGTRPDKARTKPGERSQKIVKDQNLAVTTVPAPDPDGNRIHCMCDLSRHWRNDALKHKSASTSGVQSLSICYDPSPASFGFSLFFVSPLFTHMLGKHSDMPHKRNSVRNDRFDLGKDGNSSFKLHSICSCRNQTPGILHSFLGGLIAPEWKVTKNHRSLDTTRSGPCVVAHFLHGNSSRVLVTENHHSQ